MLNFVQTLLDFVDQTGDVGRDADRADAKLRGRGVGGLAVDDEHGADRAVVANADATAGRLADDAVIAHDLRILDELACTLGVGLFIDDGRENDLAVESVRVFHDALGADQKARHAALGVSGAATKCAVADHGELPGVGVPAVSGGNNVHVGVENDGLASTVSDLCGGDDVEAVALDSLLVSLHAECGHIIVDQLAHVVFISFRGGNRDHFLKQLKCFRIFFHRNCSLKVPRRTGQGLSGCGKCMY